MTPTTFRSIIYLKFYIWIPLACEASALDLSNSNLEDVPPAPTNVVVKLLNLNRNMIRELHSNSFQNYEALVRIDLSYNGLRIVHDGVFDDIRTLKTIHMEQNKITKLPADLGPSTTVVTTFYVYKSIMNSSIFNYPYFSAFTKLQFLNIGASNFGNLDNSFFPPSVISLLATAGDIDTFPHVSSLRPFLSRLNLNGNNIKVIPQETVTGLFYLERFTLSKNKITNFPNFSHCKHLWQIHMDRNYLAMVPRQHIWRISERYFCITTGWQIWRIFHIYILWKNLP